MLFTPVILGVLRRCKKTIQTVCTPAECSDETVCYTIAYKNNFSDTHCYALLCQGKQTQQNYTRVINNACTQHTDTYSNECHGIASKAHSSLANSLAAFRAARFFSFTIKDSAVGLMSNTPVAMVFARRSADMTLVSGSAIMVLVSIQRG